MGLNYSNVCIDIWSHFRFGPEGGNRAAFLCINSYLVQDTCGVFKSYNGPCIFRSREREFYFIARVIFILIGIDSKQGSPLSISLHTIFLGPVNKQYFSGGMTSRSCCPYQVTSPFFFIDIEREGTLSSGSGNCFFQYRFIVVV